MRWTPMEPDIGEADGFTDETDIFGYKQFGMGLAKLLAVSVDDPVLLVDGDWGTGKTVFARQWAGLLRQRGNAVLYFDAFASDYQNDAFLALVEAVYEFAEKQGLAKEARRAFSTKAAKAGALGLAKSLGRHVVPGVDLTAVAEETVRATESGSSQLRAWIEDSRARKDAISEFRDSLEKLATSAVQVAAEKAAKVPDEDQASSEEPNECRLVVIVDELDRCKPDFALGILERIKHVFGVPGVRFVLVTNFVELQQSVRRAYGEVGARKYLEKFCDLRVRLPENRGPIGLSTKTAVYARRLRETLSEANLGISVGIEDVLRALADSEEMSLRTMEHVARNILVLAANRDASFAHREVTGVLISAIRVVRPDLFERIKRGEIQETDEEIVEMKLSALRPHGYGSFQDPDVAEGRLRKEMAGELSANWGLRDAARVLTAFHF